MKSRLLGIAMALGFAGTAGAAEKPVRTLQLPATPYRYSDEVLPPQFKSGEARRLDSTPASNPITDAGATLGRVLFYDTRLSANGTTACASCHHQKHAFSDPNKFSKGYEGKLTDRNAMPLVDVRFYPRGRYFWDERAATLEEQVLMPIQNKVEMGQSLEGLLKSLVEAPDYSPLFAKAFGDSKITKDRTAKALAQFVRSLVSYQSRFDEGLAQVKTNDEPFPNFTREENRGKDLFLRRCANCHMSGDRHALFSTNRALNNGLDADTKVADLGVADVTFNRFEAGQFKSPSLRNVEYTGPYMHDGRFKTLEEVVEHYSSGVKNHPTRDPRSGPVGGFRFSNGEKAALVAFLKTLSDSKFISDPKFSDPFVVK